MALKPRVVWASFAPLEKTARGLQSAVASVRYRLLVPARALESMGVECRVTHLRPAANRRTLLERFEGAQAAVFGKLLAPSAAFESEARMALEVANELRARGVKVLADFSDDHFDDPVRGEAYRALAAAATLGVASTPALAETLRRHASAVTVITDPVEGSRGEPRAPRQPPYRLLWFGHPTNLDTLAHGLPQLADFPHRLTLMTAPGTGAEAYPGGRFRPWSPQALWQELGDCDAVVIPSNPHDPRKAVKSPNRFTESVWAGRFVVAHELPSYRALADYGWVGEDLGEGLKWLARHPEESLERVRRGQAAIEQRHSPRAIGEAWKAATLS